MLFYERKPHWYFQLTTSLILATINGHLPLAELLIGAKADVDAKDVSSNTTYYNP